MSEQHTQSDGEDSQRFLISRSKLRAHKMQRLSQDTIQQRTGEQVVNNKHVQQVVNSAEGQSGEQAKGELDPEPAHLTS